MVARDRRILELRDQGLKAPAIKARLEDENPDWLESAALIRKVISLATRSAAPRERKFTPERAITAAR